MAQMIEFQRPDGATSQGYLAEAAAGAPALILIQEWWGLNDHIRSLAERFAAAGFTTLAPDLYRGRLASSADEASHLMTGLDFVDATHQDLRGACQRLAAGGRKVGVLGFCMGGALTVAAAVHVPGLAAAVCFYGIPPAGLADPAQIKIPFQGHFASRDDWCTPAAAAALEKRMRAAGAQPELYHYQADHAFFNNARPEVFDAACAQLAWERCMDFLRRHLHP
ncbi:dienelactone hydrolase family protein [Paucibacter sediminis]|uniref:Dienelactone hydrolase family protein n=1 Tax=Paucibacter sediminis TaxID=3019553 RepID=A0AA95NF53_9BURK|nr:dienelactone hydrolase family protein [Paucibacter sp. S2-9]WIT13917.1 dienelactone hydrolase family protein [Paucibacter sp. S2-9]